MHHATLDQWARGSSALHRRDARVKWLVLVAYLAALSATRSLFPMCVLGFAALAAGAIRLGRLPFAGVLARAGVVAPFAGVITLFTWLGGEGGRALAVLVRSYLSAVAVLVLVGTTPLPTLLSGLTSLGVPRFLVLVVQFLYRYLFVLSEQAQHMRLAAASRGWQAGRWRPDPAGFRAAAGVAAALFLSSQAKAQAVHRAMLARGFQGRLVTLAPPALSIADLWFLAAGVGACAGLWLAANLFG